MFGVVAVGLSLQHLLKLNPCPLCIFQRVLYLSIGVVALLGFAWPLLSKLWAGLIGGFSALGVAVAGYQSAMQAFPAQVTECGYSEPTLIERLVDTLGMQWPGLFMATGLCGSKEWSFAGLSMANWSCLFFAGCLVYAYGLTRCRQ